MSSEPTKRDGKDVRLLAIDLYALGGAVVSAEKRLRLAAAQYELDAVAIAHEEYETARGILLEHMAKMEAFLKKL